MNENTPFSTLSAAECAVRTGLTVRALRIYERHGLIAPHRTHKNWRLYGAKEIERLNEIIVLKGFGLSLARIAQLLGGQDTNLESVLLLQIETLTRQRQRIDLGLVTIAKLREEISVGKASISTLIKHAKDTMMTQIATDPRAQKLYEQARPRTEIKLDPASLHTYCGSYRIDDATIITIEQGNNCIEATLTGQPTMPLFPESSVIFFSKQMPWQFSFEKDAARAVSSITIHQSGIEMRALRISPSEAMAAEAKLAERIFKKIPFPNSENTLREVIYEAQQGVLNKTRFTPELSELIGEQAIIIEKEMGKLGQLETLTFRGVGPDGWDVYDAIFEKGQHHWRICMLDQHVTNGLFFRAGP